MLVKTQGEVLEYQVLWMRHFLATQWQYILTTTIYQDNKSTILLAKNGRTSSSKLACHLNARYFFVTDKLKKTGQVLPYEQLAGRFLFQAITGVMREKKLNLLV